MTTGSSLLKFFLDTVDKPRYDTEGVFRAIHYATTLTLFKVAAILARLFFIE
ncbi:MAG TPA: palindromic element RPE4 domain-containing protein [Rickettsia endosymbiont of Pyrocoelia pectoralis]|nr:palindromic element RPE4 domain-containing protein [Rickettsia endosymbiont of Pyrocoelia pectoralis]